LLSRHAVVWLSPVIITVHNAEEAAAFSHILPQVALLLPAPLGAAAARLTYPAMLIALGVVSLLAVGISIFAARNPKSRWGIWLVLVLQATMAINAVSHVVTAVVIFRGYAPGLITALLFNAPFAAYCFWRAREEQWVSGRWLAGVIPVALFVHGPVLFTGLWLAGKFAR
jgi:hypothetical protein